MLHIYFVLAFVNMLFIYFFKVKKEMLTTNNLLIVTCSHHLAIESALPFIIQPFHMRKLLDDNKVFHFLCILPRRVTKSFICSGTMQKQFILPGIHSSLNYINIYGKLLVYGPGFQLLPSLGLQVEIIILIAYITVYFLPFFLPLIYSNWSVTTSPAKCLLVTGMK